MSAFLILFFSVYGAIHLYFGWRFSRAFPGPRRRLFFLAIWLVLMVAAPVLVHLWEQAQAVVAATLLAYIGYGWLGFLFYFLWFSLLAQVVGLGLRLGGGEEECRAAWPRRGFVAACGLALAVLAYGYGEALSIRTEHLTVRSPKIAEGKGIRLVQVSDLHLGLIVKGERLERVLATVRAARPDLVVVTGDLVDGVILGLDDAGDALAAIEAPLGKFAILGNHEYYAGLDKALAFIHLARVTLLRDERRTIAGGLTLVGVDDHGQTPRPDRAARPSEAELLGTAARSAFTILLKHRPVRDPQSRGLFDLQLSGHTHQGQLFPFNLVTWLFFPAPSGLSVVDNQALYLSRGCGTWGPPARVLAPPEVTVIDLLPGDSQEITAP